MASLRSQAAAQEREAPAHSDADDVASPASKAIIVATDPSGGTLEGPGPSACTTRQRLESGRNRDRLRAHLAASGAFRRLMGQAGRRSPGGMRSPP